MRLVVMASPADQELIQKAVDQLEQGATPLVRNALKFYSVTPAQRTRFEAILTNLTAELPGIRVIKDAEPGELAVWAKPEQHAVLGQVLEELKRDVPEEEQYRLFVQPLLPTAAAKVVPILQELYPQLKVIQDPAKNRLLVWTTAAQFAALQQTVKELQPDAAADQQPQFKVYTLRGVAADAAVAQVQPLVPDAKLSVETATGRLIVWATPADHEILAKALQDLSTSLAAADQRQVEIFPLSKFDPTATLSLLQSLLPTAKLSIDATNNRLIAHAVPQDLLTVRALLEQLREGGKDPNASVVEFYPLEKPLDTAALAALTKLVPGAQVTAQDDRLLVVAAPADQESIQKAVERLEQGAPPLVRNVLKFYSVTPAQRTRFEGILTNLTTELPGIRVIKDAEPGELAVWARPEQHAVLGQVLEEMKREVPEDGAIPVVRPSFAADGCGENRADSPGTLSAAQGHPGSRQEPLARLDHGRAVRSPAADP